MIAKEKVISTTKTARIAGALFLLAMVTSLVGAAMIEGALGAQDYLAALSANDTQVTIGALLELINGISVILIAVMMFPILKKHDEALALGYVAFRVVEAVVIFAALIIPLTLITLSQEYLAAGASTAPNFQVLGTSFIGVRAHLAGQLLGIFFGLGALLFYYLLYRLTLVPRWISIWGLVAAALIFVWNLLELVGIHVSAGIVFGLPIILNEIFLGIWLIIKGFNSSTIVSAPA
jgi:hypothetical protein